MGGSDGDSKLDRRARRSARWSDHTERRRPVARRPGHDVHPLRMGHADPPGRRRPLPVLGMDVDRVGYRCGGGMDHRAAPYGPSCCPLRAGSWATVRPLVTSTTAIRPAPTTPRKVLGRMMSLEKRIDHPTRPRPRARTPSRHRRARRLWAAVGGPLPHGPPVTPLARSSSRAAPARGVPRQHRSNGIGTSHRPRISQSSHMRGRCRTPSLPGP